MTLSSDIPIILRTAPRDIRATRNETLARRRSPHARAVEFVQALLARFGARAWPWVPPGLVFRQDRPVIAPQVVQQHSHMHFAPRLNLTVLAWQPDRKASADDGPTLPEMRLRIDQETRVLRTLIHSSESTALERLVYRVIAQGQRIEAGTNLIPISLMPGSLANPEVSMPAFSFIPEMPPVQRVVRRAVPVETENISSQSSSRSPSESQAGNPTTHARPQLTNPAIDVNQLTDQVIKVIDRRIIAQRERLGRI